VGIRWGGPDVAERTRAALGRLGWRWREIERLWDVDRPEDLTRVVAGVADGAHLLDGLDRR
jgi:glycosyltransferase A (GT-A) superfamily protein (DUF2064 family)